MSTPFYYETEVEWLGQKRGRLCSPALPDLEVATPPEFNGHENTWSPEHLFVAGVNSCFMTTFLAIAELSKLDFAGFSVNAVGKLEKVEGRGFAITEVTLRPRLSLRREQDVERAGRLLEKAERNCLVSNSINSTVRLDPEIFVESAEAVRGDGRLSV
jgi:peroxiredoxin-like protein